MTSSTMTTISSAGLRLATLEARDALRQRAGGDEDVTLTGVAGHETEALLGVEELHLASRHGPPLCRVCGFGTRTGTSAKANRSRVCRAAGLWMPAPSRPAHRHPHEGWALPVAGVGRAWFFFAVSATTEN